MDSPRCAPSPSQRAVSDPLWAEELGLLSSEVAVRWLDPRGRDLPWLRERFIDSSVCARRGRKPREIRAVTVDRRGRTIRTFTARDDDLEAYGRLLELGRGTCPWEAVDPLTIVAGQPAIPAHLKLMVLRDAVGPGAVSVASHNGSTPAPPPCCP